MAQIFPISVLPQSSFVEYQPTATKGVDVASILNTALTFKKMEEEKRRADEEQRRYEFERRIKTTDQIIKFNESLDNLSLNAENPWQKSVMEEVNNAVDPIRKEIDYEFTTDNPNYQNIYNSMFKLSNSMRSNPKLKEALAQGLRYKNIEKQASQLKDLDEDAWNDFQAKYFSYSGENGELDPTLGFNIGSLRAFDIDKFNTRIKSYMSLTKPGIEDIDGVAVKGEYLPPIDDLLNSEWEKNKRHLSSIYGDKDTFIESMKGIYESGSFLLDDGTRFRAEDIKGGTTTTTTTTTTTDDSQTAPEYSPENTVSYKDGIYTLPDGKSIIVSPSGELVIPNKNPSDGFIAISQGDIQGPLISNFDSLTNALNGKEEAEIQINQISKNIEDAKKKYGITYDEKGRYVGGTKDQRAEIDAMKQEARDLGYKIKQFDNIINKLKDDKFYDSEGYKKYVNSINSFPVIISDILEGPLKDIPSKLMGIPKEALLKEDKDKFASFKTVGEKVSFLKSIIHKYPEHKDDLNEVINRMIEREKELYKKYSGPKETSSSPKEGYTITPDDSDSDALLKRYQVNDAKTVLRGKTVTLPGGSKYEPKDDEYINIKGVVFDPRSGKYVLYASIGKGEMDKNNKVSRVESTGEAIIKDGKDVYIEDPNVNKQIISYNLLDLNARLAGDGDPKQYNLTTEEAVKLTENLLQKISEDTKGEKGAVTHYNIGNIKYTIKNKGDNRYDITSNFDGDPMNKENLSLLEVARSIYIDYKVKAWQEYANLKNQKEEEIIKNSTQGGGTTDLGKSFQMGSNLMETMAINSETKGRKEPYTAVNADTNALGKYQFTPIWYDKIENYFNENWSKYYTEEQKKELLQRPYKKGTIQTIKDLGLNKNTTNKQLDIANIFLNTPKLQDDFAQYAYDSEYKNQIPKVIEAFNKKGKKINEIEALDILHQYGSTNALKGIGEPRKWTKNFQKPVVSKNKDIENFKPRFNPGVSYEGISKENRYGFNALMKAINISDLDYYITSGYRKGDKNDHGGANAIDIDITNIEQEEEALRRICNLTRDPQRAWKILMVGKGTNGHGIPTLNIPVNANGKMLKILYHKNSENSRDKEGNHIHISIE